MLIKTDIFAPLIVFCIVTSFTPGPNNLMLMTSGLNFGFRRTLPHLAGVISGFFFLVFYTGLGVGAVFARYPLVYTVVKYAGAAYMLYLAWIIAGSGSVDEGAAARKTPMRFFQAVAFQLVNAKGWAMAVGAVSSYAAIADYPFNMGFIAAAFGVVGIASGSSWAGLGMVLQRFLHRPRVLRAFNVVMAVLLVASLYPVFADVWR